MGWLKSLARRRVLAKHSIGARLWARALRHLPFLSGLSDDETRRLQDMAVLFLAEKEFTPLRGLQLSEDDRVEIALQACLPVLELGLGAYEGWVGIVVHPSDFQVRRSRVGEDGVVHEWDDELAGESWPGGPIVLSWEALDDAGSVADGGANVVIHEFVHKLDMMDGEADGVPPLPSKRAREHWIEVFDAEYDRFCQAVDAGEETFLDPYAAEEEAEFFAVASEAFFETPNALKGEFPQLYELFKEFYRQDPALRLKT
ncbi:MAG: zinc-dependent peptidase [Betaproteobacteria bacterium]|nr:zinc-dependent peptidase [Betaproteobacteria bacterium]